MYSLKNDNERASFVSFSVSGTVYMILKLTLYIIFNQNVHKLFEVDQIFYFDPDEIHCTWLI